MILQKILHNWPLIRGRDRFFRLLPEKIKLKLDELENPVLLKNKIKIFVSTKDFLSRWLKCYGEYETTTSQILLEYATSNEVFLDIGANYGLFTLEIASFVNCPVISFEPNPNVEALLRKSIQINNLNSSVKVFRVALSDFKGKANFTERSENLGASSLTVDKIQGDNKTFDVSVESLDNYADFQNYLNSLNLPVGLIKMDIEGAELSAIKGMRNILIKYQPTLVIELLEKQLISFGTSKNEVVLYLQSIGYILTKEFDGNGLFIHKNSIPKG